MPTPTQPTLLVGPDQPLASQLRVNEFVGNNPAGSDGLGDVQLMLHVFDRAVVRKALKNGQDVSPTRPRFLVRESNGPDGHSAA